MEKTADEQGLAGDGALTVMGRYHWQMQVQREGRGPQQARTVGMLQGSATLVAGSRCFSWWW